MDQILKEGTSQVISTDRSFNVYLLHQNFVNYVLFSHQLQITMVMSKGQVDADLLALCTANGIIILQQVPYKALLALADEKDIVTYITDAAEVS